MYVGEATRLPRCEKSVFRIEDSAMLRIQRPISERYTEATAQQLSSMIASAKKTLGDEVFILGHHYQRDEVMEWADARGDSFKLAQLAQERPEAKHIVFCGVHFMAESAKILSMDKTVLIPDERAGCSLAETITADQLRAWKAEHPGAVVVSYVNTTAAVKAETDICCTSSNAVDVVNSIPADTPVLFGPDQFLGAHVQRITGRENMHIWMGECHVHAGINGADLNSQSVSSPTSRALRISRVSMIIIPRQKGCVARMYSSWR